jgi:uncharacterized membrane protein YfcA
VNDPWLWLSLCILLAYSIEAISGFGSVLIALSLGALLLPVSELLPILVPLNVLMSGWLGWRNRQHIHWRLLLGAILPLMLMGTLAGYALTPWLQSALALQLFGVLVLWFGASQLFSQRQPSPAGATWQRLGLVGAGISHGLFASGGPLLVYTLAGSPLDKRRLRATLITVWFVLNSLLSLAFLADGRLQPALPHIAVYAPLLLVGGLLGEYLTPRLNEQRFRQLVYGLLAVVGALLIAKGWFGG